ncbi:arylsulfatase [Solimonas terrae]|uniref:Arylsulfatase n=1 Tax=Solimonas terrae TaxID=1396819 RepID=A0A6M2BT96_9GAMM|nr:arylsulfatase [Solimonas terrae]NGY05708.1 arylsulfatase [Solimonas terrae]
MREISRVRAAWRQLLPIAACLLLAACGQSSSIGDDAGSGHGGSANARPNVVVILADDVGYSDISAFGSEIQTPNLDALARAGQILTNFHTTPLCATSRVELLTGADHHLVGMGEMGSMKLLYTGASNPNYAGQFDPRGLSIAQMLKDAGYHTYMAGKWGIGGVGPQGEGFEHAFYLDPNADYASNFAPPAGYKPGLATNPPYPVYEPHYEDGQEVSLPDDYFSSDYYADKLMQYIGAAHGDGKPFFAYLPFQATHFPLQAPAKYLDCTQGTPKCYKSVYDAGYDAIRDARLQRMKDLGIIPQDFKPSPGDEVTMTRFGQPGVLTNTPWSALTAAQQTSEARLMEVYAAMLTNLDDNVGRLIAYLKSIGEYDNTMIVFFSDNGADGMGYGFIPFVDSNLNLDIDNSLANYGRQGSFIFRSTRWAEVGTAPFRLFKSFPSEGGISVPTIVKMPGGQSLAPSGAYAQLTDIVPTVLALTGVAPPDSEYDGRSLSPIEGTSLLPLLTGRASAAHTDDAVFADEVAAQRYVRQGPWKMTRIANAFFPSAALLLPRQWQLYNIDTDRGETTDVAADNPEEVQKLTQAWAQYVERVDAINPTVPPQLIPIGQ